MPVVLLKRNPKTVDDETISKIRNDLRTVVAIALNVSGDEHCELTPADVDVEIQDDHPLDHNERDFGIIVVANAHPRRMMDLTERAEFIRDAIKNMLGDTNTLRGYVYITPNPGAHARI
jgi:hypothetical protein